MNEYLTQTTPSTTPVPYKPALVPEGMLVHAGIFSPDLKRYYLTLSDKQFQRFDVKVVEKQNGQWSAAKNAFFNSEYNEHGLSFSADGNTAYFSSTRPVAGVEVADTWHLWRSSKVDGQWTTPQYIDIPNLRDKLTMHPTVSNDGTVYFHAGPADYSDLNIYYAKNSDGQYADAVKLPGEINFGHLQNTALIAADESYLLFEAAGALHISHKDEKGRWLKAKPLDDKINQHGHGNPFLTPDHKYLFYVAGMPPNPDETWSVYWVSSKNILAR